MGESRIDTALERLAKAMARIENARRDPASLTDPSSSMDNPESTAPESVTKLVDTHEKLREEVAETLRELDLMIEEFEA